MADDKNFYRDPLIAMAFFACLFFIILVVIIALWCKNRRQVEVKTISIQPKRRPISTAAKTQPTATNGDSNGVTHADVEAQKTNDESDAVHSEDVKLSDVPAETPGSPNTSANTEQVPDVIITTETEMSTKEETLAGEAETVPEGDSKSAIPSVETDSTATAKKGIDNASYEKDTDSISSTEPK